MEFLVQQRFLKAEYSDGLIEKIRIGQLNPKRSDQLMKKTLKIQI